MIQLFSKSNVPGGNLSVCSLLSFTLGFLWSINYGADYQEGGLITLLGLLITVAFFLSLFAGEDYFREIMVQSLSRPGALSRGVARRVLRNQYAFFFLYFTIYFSVPFACSAAIANLAAGSEVSWGGDLLAQYGVIKVVAALISGVVASGGIYAVGRTLIPRFLIKAKR